MTPFSKRKAGWLIPQNSKGGSLACFDAQCFKLFLYNVLLVSNLNRLRFVSMLNVLSFFFIWLVRYYERFWFEPGFDAQCFELFLYHQEVRRALREQWPRFDAQCFELFLYIAKDELWKWGETRFDTQCSELFLYECSLFIYYYILLCFDAQRFELFLY